MLLINLAVAKKQKKKKKMMCEGSAGNKTSTARI